MKNLVKVFGLMTFSVVLFSCSTEEQDNDLERAMNLSVKMKEIQDTKTNEDEINITARDEDGTPIIIVKKD